MIKLPQVTVSAPTRQQVRPMSVWRLSRTDEEIKRDFRKFVLDHHRVVVAWDEIEIDPRQEKAA